MGIKSINEPQGPGHIEMVFPASINEPPVLPDPPPEIEPPEAKAHARHEALADPDDLENEIEEAAEEGDFKPTHQPHRKKRKH